MMGSYMNFKNFGEAPQSQGNGGKLAVGTPLDRQSSVYSLTFEEFQNTLGGSGKDFGSMNMDELLKNIWTAEETQAMATSTVTGGQGSSTPSGNLLRQGSLTLPRTLSQKTVDEVWKELFKENSGINVKDVVPTGAGSNMQLHQRQPTFGEITLEEFLFRAGVVREDARPMDRPNDNGSYNGASSLPNSNPQGLNIGFGNNLMPNHPPSSLPMNVSGLRPSQPQLLQPLFPKQANVTFASSTPVANNTQFVSSGTGGTTVGIADPSSMNGALLQGGMVQGGPLGMGTVGSATKMGATAGSPPNQVSPDVLAKSNGDTSSVSPPPYMLGGGVRGRKSGTLEKAMERRHRRMIKNRESAARSRARKQAYTLELEAEVAKLKEMNEELQKKQDEFMEMQKNQALETIKMPRGNKRRCLRRTLTGPW